MEQVTEIRVRNTELVDFASCPKKYQLVWIKGIRPRKTDPKLQVGSLVHKFLEVYETDLKFFPAHEAMVNLSAEYASKLRADDEEGREEVNEVFNLAYGMVNGYANWRPSDLSPITISEGQFEVSIGGLSGIRVILTGTLDGLGQDSDGNIWIREYKTCASINDKLKQYSLDRQTRRYVYALRKQGIPVKGVELVLLAKTLPLADEDFIIKGGIISRDQNKWAKASYAQAVRIAKLGKFAEEGAKNGLTEQAYYGILKTLETRDNPFFRVERLVFGETELIRMRNETLIEAVRIQAAKEAEAYFGDDVWTRNSGVMGFNCKSCPVKTLCEMELKGIDTSLVIQEHYEVVDPRAMEVEGNDEDEDSLDS